jgi:hypothetical protein
VNEHVFTAVIADHEAEALLRVEELDHAGAFANDLGGHAATAAEAAATTAAATEAAATAAAEAATVAATKAAAAAATAAEAAATAAEPVTAAEAAATETTAEVATAKAAAAEIVIAAEAIALVAPTPATIAAATFIETHKPCSSSRFARHCILKNPSAGRRAEVFKARNSLRLLLGIADSIELRE